MQKCITVLLIVFITGVLCSADALAQPSSLRGKVRWITGAPAIGMEVKIQRNKRVMAVTYTNDRGLYAFFNINPPFHGIVVVVSDSYRVLKEKHITDIGPNGELPDITIE